MLGLAVCGSWLVKGLGVSLFYISLVVGLLIAIESMQDIL